MFTGIITHVGRIRRVIGDRERELEIEPGFALADVTLGASIAHSGVCLTVTRKTGETYWVACSPETLARTTVGSWRAGDAINLERSLRLGDELGGHLVFGHVDGVGRIETIAPEGDCRRLVVKLPPELLPLVAVKGGIAIDGISLTVNTVGQDHVGAMIIPHTWLHTTLARRRVGDPVNVEVDMLARYVARQLAFATKEASDVR